MTKTPRPKPVEKILAPAREFKVPESPPTMSPAEAARLLAETVAAQQRERRAEREAEDE